jgi:iron complex transport system substrate-binding protein
MGPRTTRTRATIIALAFALGWDVAAADARPQRIVSTNVCADQLVLLLADPDDIASVSSLAVDAEVSNLADQARGHTLNHARAEEIIRLAPDLVVGDVQTGRHANALARSIGVPVHLVDWPTSLGDVERIIRELGAVIGQDARAAKVVAAMKARMGPRRTQKVTALVYEANGLTTGKGTLSDDVLSHAGFRNIAGRLTGNAYGALPLEAVVANPPRLLVMDESYAASSSRAQALLRHPALASLARTTAVHRMPSRLWLCPGPWVADAVAGLAARRDELGRSLATE